MDVKLAVQQELSSFTCEDHERVATVGTTARESHSFAVLPRRKAFGLEAINFLVTDEASAITLFQQLDGRVAIILVDVEMKKNLDLLSLANRYVKKAAVVSYKPNDTTLEAADFFLRHYYQEQLEGKKIIIYGAGNLGSKLALRLAERGADVFLGSRNKEKLTEIITALNHLLPACSRSEILMYTPALDMDIDADALISFTSASSIIPPSYTQAVKRNGLGLDGGIDNFTKQFIKEAADRHISLYRLDVRAAFPHSLLYVTDYIKEFYTAVQGEKYMSGIRLVAGGIIGREGDLVVDRIQHPRQIVGIANGIGGLKHPASFSESEKTSIQTIQKALHIE